MLTEAAIIYEHKFRLFEDRHIYPWFLAFQLHMFSFLLFLFLNVSPYHTIVDVLSKILLATKIALES